MVSIAFCLLTALAGVRLGVSSELGAFMAGVMVSATDQQEQMQHQLGELPSFHLLVVQIIPSSCSNHCGVLPIPPPTPAPSCRAQHPLLCGAVHRLHWPLFSRPSSCQIPHCFALFAPSTPPPPA